MQSSASGDWWIKFVVVFLAAAVVAGCGGGSGTSSSANGSTNNSGSVVSGDSVVLSWAAPTQNTDGTAITDLSGYNIYYGSDAQAMTQKINVTNVGVLTYVVSSLSPGTWYFAVTSVNSAGIESDPSEPINATI
jgi:hypothetical protein